MYSAFTCSRETTRGGRFRYIVHMKVTVLLGGTSSERDVSLASGLRIAHALRDAGHTVTSVDPARGEMTRAQEDELRAAGVVKREPPTREALKAMAATSLVTTLGAMARMAQFRRFSISHACRTPGADISRAHSPWTRISRSGSSEPRACPRQTGS